MLLQPLRTELQVSYTYSGWVEKKSPHVWPFSHLVLGRGHAHCAAKRQNGGEALFSAAISTGFRKVGGRKLLQKSPMSCPQAPPVRFPCPPRQNFASHTRERAPPPHHAVCVPFHMPPMGELSSGKEEEEEERKKVCRWKGLLGDRVMASGLPNTQHAAKARPGWRIFPPPPPPLSPLSLFSPCINPKWAIKEIAGVVVIPAGVFIACVL